MTIQESQEAEKPTKFILNDTMYIKLKYISMVFLPALSALYFGLGSIWDLPAVEQVVGSIAVVNTFFGTVVGISSRTYYKSELNYDGTIVIGNTEEGTKLYSLELKGSPDEIDDKKSITFKVGSPVL